jgi:hypothetical protein
VWDTATGRKLCSLADERRCYVQDFYFAGEGQLLVVVESFSRTYGSSPRWVTPKWHLAPSPTRTAVLWTMEPLQYSVAGKWLALPHRDDAVLIDVDTGEERELQARFDEKRLLVPLLDGTHPALSPNSQLLAVAGLCKQLRQPLPKWLPKRLNDFLESSVCETHFWDTSTGQEHASILPGRIALFSPDGQTLLTLEKGIIRLWALPLHRPLARDLGLSALLWLTLMLLAGVGRVRARMIFRVGR